MDQKFKEHVKQSLQRRVNEPVALLVKKANLTGMANAARLLGRHDLAAWVDAEIAKEKW